MIQNMVIAAEPSFLVNHNQNADSLGSILGESTSMIVMHDLYLGKI